MMSCANLFSLLKEAATSRKNNSNNITSHSKYPLFQAQARQLYLSRYLYDKYLHLIRRFGV